MGADRNVARRMDPPGAESDDPLEKLRRAFIVRLGEDRVRFLALRAALGARQVPPEAIVAELRARAHKMRGAAAIFEMRELCAAASLLEDATIAASVQVKQGEAMVEAPLGALIDFLEPLTSG